AAASAGTDPRFEKRILVVPNGRHEIVDEDTALPVVAEIDRWLRYSFATAPPPTATPQVQVAVDGGRLRFRVTAPAGGAPLAAVDLLFATEIDTTRNP